GPHRHSPDHAHRLDRLDPGEAAARVVGLGDQLVDRLGGSGRGERRGRGESDDRLAQHGFSLLPGQTARSILSRFCGPPALVPAALRCHNQRLRRMTTTPAEIRLVLNPSRRFEAIDVNERIRSEAGDLLSRYSRTLYCSLHTTAGYLDQSLAGRMHHHHGRLAQFFDAWHALFPPDGGYSHDQME